jgi:hypothetical protein
MKNHQMGDAERDLLTVYGGPRTRSMALPSLSPHHKTDFSIVLRYWRNFTEDALKSRGFYSTEGFLFQTCN